MLSGAASSFPNFTSGRYVRHAGKCGTHVREFTAATFAADTQLGFMWRAWLGLGRCWGCGIMLLANEVAGTCPGCRLAWPVLPPSAGSQALGQMRAGALPWALGFRLCAERGTSQVLHRMKYGGLTDPALRLGRWMSAAWPSPPPGTVLVPVPSHWRRRLRRGFNPSESLARGLAWNCGLAVEPSLLVSAQALADGVLAGGAHACVGGLLREHAHPECEEGGGGRRCVDHGCDVPNLRPGVGG